MINALKFTEELEKAGFSPEQAKKSVETWMSLINDNFTTKSDLREFQLANKSDLREVQINLEGQIKDLRTDLKHLRTDLEAQIKDLRTEMQIQSSKIVIQLGTVMIASLTIGISILALILNK